MARKSELQRNGSGSATGPKPPRKVPEKSAAGPPRQQRGKQQEEEKKKKKEGSTRTHPSDLASIEQTSIAAEAVLTGEGPSSPSIAAQATDALRSKKDAEPGSTDTDQEEVVGTNCDTEPASLDTESIEGSGNATGTEPIGSPATIGQDGDLPIVGLGASAGGLEAFESFIRLVPPDSGMAFVLVTHLDPGHVSMLTEILQRSATIPVVEAQNQMAVAPNHVYVIPPNRDLAVLHGAIHLSIPESPRGHRMPIDYFLRSLADDQGEKAIGVILSGTGTDGTLGLRAIHGAGGASFVQEPSTARYDGMPTSAVQSGLATYVLPVEKIPEQLLIYVRTLMQHSVRPAPAIEGAALGAISKITFLLRARTGHDFALYKQSTIRRRIERRMTVHNIESVDEYARYLQQHPPEMDLLFKELLINVTSFFRDPEAFEVLKKEVLPELMANAPDDYTLRIWVPACSTGEEAYSIAILLKEHMDETKREFRAQIYSTDIDKDAVAVARSGAYPPNIAIDVSPERLRRFFTKEEAGYRVKKNVREMVIFAVQNVIKDPPFTRLDLVSCRNLLIYLEPELQNRLVPAFHYALKPSGVLFLSPSESIGSHSDLFSPVNRKWRIYRSRMSAASARAILGTATPWTARIHRPGRDEIADTAKSVNLTELTKRVLLQSYAPASVVTDEKGCILYVHGDTGRYLRPAPGNASLSVIDMAREGLQLELRAAIHNAASRKVQVVARALRVRTNGNVQEVDLSVAPLTEPDAAQGLLIISFQETHPEPEHKATRAKRAPASPQQRRVEEIEQELLYTKENLQAGMEELQAANEELKSANEELQSTNEEFQSTNEELETSKEELQSINEELVTVNTELQAKIEQLAEAQNDLKNLLDNINIGTIFLDESLSIKRFTREATRVYRLVLSDVGRPLADIKAIIEDEGLIGDAQAVLDELVPREREVRSRTTDSAGIYGWYLVRVLPYRTLDNVIEGVVLTFTDITERKRAEAAIREAREYAENVVDTVRQPLAVLDSELTILSANRAFYSKFGTTPQETVSRRIFDLGNRQWDNPRLKTLLGTILRENTSFEDFEVEHDFPTVGRRRMLLNARRILDSEGKTHLILLAMEDATDLATGTAEQTTI